MIYPLLKVFQPHISVISVFVVLGQPPTMNTAKIMPYGKVNRLSAVASAGVHMNTKVYIAPSKEDCAQPKRMTPLSTGSKQRGCVSTRIAVLTGPWHQKICHAVRYSTRERYGAIQSGDCAILSPLLRTDIALPSEAEAPDS